MTQVTLGYLGSPYWTKAHFGALKTPIGLAGLQLPEGPNSEVHGDLSVFGTLQLTEKVGKLPIKAGRERVKPEIAKTRVIGKPAH